NDRRVPGGDFSARALSEGALEVESARSAQLRGAAAEVRRLAQHMEHAHGAINKRLSEAAGTEVPVPDDAQRAALHAVELNQGDAFDQAWLRHEAQSHARAIQLFQAEMRRSGPGHDLAAELPPEPTAPGTRMHRAPAGRPARAASTPEG